MNRKNNALELHRKLRGKLAIISKIQLNTKNKLSSAYTPGVSQAVKEIVNHPDSIYDLTIKRNTVAVVTDGSAVLGLGNTGPEAALPVMEGKCAIFKEFAGINAFPICLKTQDVDEIIKTIVNISPVFGGINLEDISAPRCFEIEERLQKELEIPIMHDDQHATAIVVLAGLLNAVKVVHKKLNKCKIVITGTGAAGTAIIKLLSFLKIRNIMAVDRKGIINKRRNDLNFYKKEIAAISNSDGLSGNLKEAAKNADILIGVSGKGLFTRDIVEELAENPIIFALANPDPEIIPEVAKKIGVRLIATGRSDYPNQINNALVFPGFFRGLLKYRIKVITNEMKIKAAQSLASLVPNPSAKKFIPSILDKRVVPAIEASLRP